MAVRYFETIPEQVNMEAEAFLKWMGKPSVIKAGNGEGCVMLFCLVHGNEPSGFYAFYELLRKLYQKDELEKEVYFVFVNLRAALHEPIFSKRYLEDESDMNRIWTKPGCSEEQNEVVAFLKKFIEEKKPKLLVDFHNTTGKNHVYLYLNNLDMSKIKEYSYFADFIVYPLGENALIGKYEQGCLGFLVECGKNTEEASHKNAKEILDRVLIYAGAKEGKLEPSDKVKVAWEKERIIVDPEAEISFADENTGEDVVFRSDLDELNTITLPAGTKLGWVNKEGAIIHNKLDVVDKELILKEKATMILLTAQVEAIKKDCLGYFVEVEEVVF